MAVQWYPGHMTKARKAIAGGMSNCDVVIEVVDARMPLASQNPVLAEIRGNKPCLTLLNKSDLADEAVTKEWLVTFEARAQDGEPILAAPVQATHGADLAKRITGLCRKLAPHRTGPIKPLRAMIVGIPNVGKSTLMNVIVSRKVAKVGDEPAVTKSAQRITLDNGLWITDNPGILWPKIENESSALRLALCAAIPDTAIDYETVALFGARFFLAAYPDRLLARYKLTSLPSEASDLLLEIGRRRGGLRAGGVVDVHKAAGVLMHDFRSGALGRISLEDPASAELEEAALAATFAEDDEDLDDGGDFDTEVDA